MLHKIEYINDTPSPSITIIKRVDALKLMMNYRHFGKRVEVNESKRIKDF